MIFTFYSFKGGVGRSMALANIAELFYARGLNVLMIDFDLEAPGLERYFDVKNSITPSSEIPNRLGVIDFILSFLELQSFAPKLPPAAPAESDSGPAFPFSVEPIRNFIVPIYDDPSRPGRLSLMPSGNRRKPDFASYAKRVLGFDWGKFYSEKDGEKLFEWFRLQLARDWDVVLIDSRTGVTEVGGVCTHHLADAVVSFVATNLQNLDGSSMMARSLANPKLVNEGRKGRALQQLFVPSRVELSEEDKHDEFAKNFNEEFGKYFPEGQAPSQDWFLDLRLFYVPAYSYMERVAVREPERASKADLIQAYGRLAARMANMAGRGAVFEAWAPPSRTLSNLPPRNLYFSGREEELKHIAALIATGTPVAICGLGGMGKSSLAVEYAYRHRGEYATTLFCPAGSEDEMTRGCQEIMRLLSIRTGNVALPEAVRAWLEANEGWLLILDNAVDPALVRRVLPRSLRGHVLYTTRTQQVSALGAQSVAIETMSSQAGVDFFEKRLGKREWNDAERAAAEELVDELGALPLALEQAVAYIVNRNTRIQDYVASYRKRRLNLLDQQTATIGGREVSLTAALEPTLEAIERFPASADVLRVASFLAPDPIPTFLLVTGANQLSESIGSALESAQDDPLAIDQVLDPLTRFSLIDRNRESQSLSVHKLVADLVRSRTKNPEAWQQRTVAALDAVFPAPNWKNTAVCAALIPHVMAVASGSNRGPLLLRGAQFLIYRGEYARAEQLLEGAGSLGDTVEGIVRMQLMAQIHFAQGHVPHAVSILQEAQDLARGLNLDGRIRNQLSASLAECFFAMGEPAMADRLWIEVLADAQVMGDTRNVVLSLCGRAGILAHSNPTDAMYEAHRAVSYARSAGPDLVAVANGSLATVLITTGRASDPEALSASQEAIAAAERAYGTEHPLLARVLRTYAIVLHANGRGTEGDAVYRRATDIIDASLGAQSAGAAAFRNEYETLLASAKTTTHKIAQVSATVVLESRNEKSDLTQGKPDSTKQSPIEVPPKPGRRTFIVVAVIAAVIILAAASTTLYFKFLKAPLTPSSTQPTPSEPVAPAKPEIPEWGVEISADKTLEPAFPGGPSAAWEPVRVWRERQHHAVIFHKDSFYVTVIEVPDSESAKNLVSKLKDKAPYENWRQAEVVHISQWCPSPVFSQRLTVAEVAMNVYECDSGNLK